MYRISCDPLRSSFVCPVSQMRCVLYCICEYTYRHALFYHTLLYYTLQTRCLLQMQGLWQPCLCHFSSNIRSLRVSMSHFGNSLNLSNFFIIIMFVMVICDQSPLMLLLQLPEGSDDSQHLLVIRISKLWYVLFKDITLLHA